MATNALETYEQVLGESRFASVATLKRAYRQKAKALHPDKNKNPNAHEEFVLLTEAYECLMANQLAKSKTPQKKAFSSWDEESRAQARQRAKAYAETEFEHFKQTDYYKNAEAAFTVIERLSFLSAILMLLSPVWGYLIDQWSGFGFGLLISFMTVSFWARLFTHKPALHWGSFWQALVTVGKTKTFGYAMAVLLNVWLLGRFSLYTQLTMPQFGLIFLALYGLAFLGLYFKMPFLHKCTKPLLLLAVVPGFFNLFFVSNFAFSAKPTTEVHAFVHEQAWYASRFGRGRFEKIAVIKLADSKYAEYVWFRVFSDFEAMQYKREITYRFEEGLFGLRVLKAYEFTK